MSKKDLTSTAQQQRVMIAGMPDNTLKTLANSIFKNLRGEGCRPNDIISVSTHLLSLVTTEIASNRHKD